MNLLTIQKKFNTQQKCITYLEKSRWGDTVISPFSGKPNITKRVGTIKYHCNDTNQDFSVLYGTIFQDTRLPLPKWFMLIALMLNAKKGIASAQLSRDLGISYKTAWYCQMRVRCAMVDKELELEGLLEMDEAFVGGKPRKKYSIHNEVANISRLNVKRGRGTKKTPIVGIAEKKGNVSVKVIEKLTGKNLLAMLKRYSKLEKSAVITDDFRSYKALDNNIDHITISDRDKYVQKGLINIATLDNFFSRVKNGIRGNYVVISKKYLPFYLVEFQFKFNKRNEEKDAFEKLIISSVSDDKCMIDYKPIGQIKSITNPSKRTISKKKRLKSAVYK